LSFQRRPEARKFNELDPGLRRGDEYFSVSLSDQVVAVTAFFHIHLPIPDHILSREIARLTLIFRLEANGWMIVYSGISIPYHLVQEGEVYGRTPVHVATYARQREAIKLLAKAGADLGLLEHDRYDAVTIAAVADDEDTLRLLLALGASAKLTTSRYDGTALIAAAHLGHVGIVRQLIAAGAPLDHVNNLHWTAVIEAVVLGDGGPRHQATLRALIDAGANLQLADRYGSTPLILARQRGYTAMVKMLEGARGNP